ncbi:hypothetical protein LIZ34_03520, partial [Intestinimonas butyriciproducens]|uniref:hypothetical protein n=1 Tax=Intestinimonas butyriciproducens TaxID=1297617 RepID=UPI001D07306E
GKSLWIFLLGVQLHYAINRQKTIIKISEVQTGASCNDTSQIETYFANVSQLRTQFDGQRLQWGSLPDGRLPRYPPPQGRRKLLFEVNGVGRCILRPAQGRRQSGRKSVCRPSADLRKVTGAL